MVRAAPPPDRDTLHRRATRHLGRVEPAFRDLIRRIGPCRLLPEATRSPYEALVRAIAHQQVHGRAAAAVLGRFVALFPDHDFPPPVLVLASETAVLRGCGFSGAKVAAVQDIAAAAADGRVPDRQAADALADEELIERLVALRGVGRWTVEMLLIFTLGRMDILPVDDFGVREGWRKLMGLEAQPKPRELAAIGAAWSPYRSIAAWYLWRASEEGRKPAASEVT